jgi:transcriptional regulator with XRE-family HTH domain
MGIDYISLGKNIKKYRLAAELTQAKLAEIVGCSDRHIGKIEGGNIPSLAVTVAIANALNVGIDQLVYGNLDNPMDYFIRELVSLTEGFEVKKKLLSIELTKSLVSVLKEYM